MCYPFMYDNHPDAEVSKNQIRCHKHNLMHDAGTPCLKCLQALRVSNPEQDSFGSSWHAEREVAVSD